MPKDRHAEFIEQSKEKIKFPGVFFENTWDPVLCMPNTNMLDKINMQTETLSYASLDQKYLFDFVSYIYI